MRETADFNPDDFKNVGDTTGVYATFFILPKKDKVKSAQEGRDIFSDVEYVEIRTAGNNNNIIKRPVEDKDRMRFSASYRRFKEGSPEQLEGTPLSEVTWISRAMVEELNYIKVRTLEQLASLNDQACMNMPGIFDLKRKAALWLEESKKAAPFTAMHDRITKLEAQLAAATASAEAEPKAKKSA